MSIIDTIKANDLVALEAALRRSDPNKPDVYGWTPLHYAFALDYPDMVRALLNRGASLNIKSFESDTPIEIGLIFKSMNCLRVVENMLTDNSHYQALLRFEAEGKIIKQNLHGRAKYLAYAELARKYVRDERKIKSFNHPDTDDVEGQKQLQDVVFPRYKIIAEIFKNNLQHIDGSQFFVNYFGEKTNTGNCDAQTGIAYFLCKRVFGLRKAELFRIEKSGSEFLDQFKPIDDRGNHVALLLGRNEPSVNNSYRFWGKNAVVCDPWANSVFPATEIENKLYNLISVRVPFGGGRSIPQLKLFDPKIYNLDFYEDQDTVRLPHPDSVRSGETKALLTQYYGNRKQMTKVEKIDALKAMIAKRPVEDTTIGRVIEHKEANLRRL